MAAFNLRPAITSFGVLLEEVRKGLHLSGGAAGVLTSLPAVCFAVFGATAPRLTRKFGIEATLCGGMSAIAAGLLLRPLVNNIVAFLLLSICSLMGIAVGNVLVPVVVKRYFPRRVGPMTGLYSMALGLGMAVPAAVAVPIAGLLGGGWRGGLAIWAAPAALAMLPWLLLSRRRDGNGGREQAPEEIEPPILAQDASPRNLAHSSTAWALACYFGLQSASALITMGWMPQRFRDAGIPAGTAGVLLAVAMSVSVPLASVVPPMAARMKNQGTLVLGLGGCGLASITGLYAAPAGGAWAWVVLLGISNCSFPLALTMIAIRARNEAGVARLSTFAQSIGYLISVPGPLLFGVVYQRSGGWTHPLLLMASLMVLQTTSGLVAGRNRATADEPQYR